MKRNWISICTWLLWLALPLTALRYLAAWDQLPVRMATHFDAGGRPNGWMSRETSLGFALGITALMLLVFTLLPYLLSRKRAVSAAFSWATLAFAAFIVGFVFYVNDRLIQFNLTGRSMELGPGMLMVPVAIVVLTVLYIAGQRGQPLAAATGIAEETHASRAWALVFLVLAVPEVMVLTVVRLPAAQVAMGLVCALFAIIAAQAWSGFQYRFTSAGVEIRTLGVRLQSIALDQIRGYGIERWNLLRGYGIRGVGNTRAYVWGNRVVHITTAKGDVFLGHDDPARVVRDLDAIRGLAHS
jgi:hypothetical protein